MGAMFYKMKSKVYTIEGKINHLANGMLEGPPTYAVRIFLEHTGDDTVVITDGTFCYFESFPVNFYKLIRPIELPPGTTVLQHKTHGPIKLHL
jgi:hypothetical protein